MIVYLINMPANTSDERRRQSLGMAYLASDLLNNDIEVNIIDGCGIHRDITYNEVMEDIILSQPPFIGFYVIEFNIATTLKLIHDLKRKYSFISFLGGPQASILGKEIISNNPDVDLITCGEMDGKLPLILKGNYAISGLIYRNDMGQIIVNDTISKSIDLDTLPYPVRDLNGKTLLTKNILNGIERYVVPVSSSRGCPFRCAFCSIPALNKQHNIRWRFRSADNIVNEIREVHNKYNNIEVVFVDDNFLVNIERALIIAKTLYRLGQFPFSFTARVDEILRADESVLIELSKCGLHTIEVGIENFNDNVLRRYNKGHTSEEAVLAIRRLQNCQIHPNIDFIMFDPWTTLSELEKNLYIMESEKLDTYLGDIIFDRIYPYPGIAMYDQINMKQYFENSDTGKIYDKMQMFKGKYRNKIWGGIVETEKIINKIALIKAPYKFLHELIKNPDLSFSESVTIKMLTNVMK